MIKEHFEGFLALNTLPPELKEEKEIKKCHLFSNEFIDKSESNTRSNDFNLFKMLTSE